MAHRFTIGVEEEFQIIDPATCELRSHVSQLVSAASPDIAEQVKHELHQSIVETGTRICDNVSELRIEMHRTRGELVAAAERVGLQVAAAGTHPFSSWIDQVISPGERYQHIVEEMGQLARSLLIFGMHVHVAMPDKQTTIDMMNGVRYFLPHLLALLPAAFAGAFYQFAVLDGKEHGIEVLPHDGVSQVPADRRPGAIRIVERVRKFRESSCEAELYRQRQKDLVGRAPAPYVRHIGIPHV